MNTPAPALPEAAAAKLIVDMALTWPEMLLSADVGVQRNLQSMESGRQHLNGMLEEDGFKNHILGAAGELAVAKWLGVFWTGQIGRLDADDVGILQVRASFKPNSGLKMQDRDKNKADRKFILVVGTPPTLQIVGWILGADGLASEFWDEQLPRPCYQIPQSRLLDLALLTAPKEST